VRTQNSGLVTQETLRGSGRHLILAPRWSDSLLANLDVTYANSVLIDFCEQYPLTTNPAITGGGSTQGFGSTPPTTGPTIGAPFSSDASSSNSTPYYFLLTNPLGSPGSGGGALSKSEVIAPGTVLGIGIATVLRTFIMCMAMGGWKWLKRRFSDGGSSRESYIGSSSRYVKHGTWEHSCQIISSNI
jgi:hypothetical protein